MENNEKIVTMVINNTPTPITQSEFMEYSSNSKFKVKKIEEEDDKFILLEKMHG